MMYVVCWMPWITESVFYIIWRQFGQMRRYRDYRPGRFVEVYRQVGLASARRPGHGLVHLLLESAVELGFASSAFRVGDLGYDVSSCCHCEIIRIGMGCTTKSASSSRTKTPARIFTHRFIPDAKRLCLDGDRR